MFGSSGSFRKPATAFHALKMPVFMIVSMTKLIGLAIIALMPSQILPMLSTAVWKLSLRVSRPFFIPSQAGEMTLSHTHLMPEPRASQAGFMIFSQIHLNRSPTDCRSSFNLAQTGLTMFSQTHEIAAPKASHAGLITLSQTHLMADPTARNTSMTALNTGLITLFQ